MKSGTLVDIVGITGLGLVAVGAWMVYPPASLITVGATMLFVAERCARLDHPVARRKG